MPAGAFEIRELTGSQRRVVLRGRALPYQGAMWEVSQRERTKWYAGNPVATQQVLGPEEMPTTIEGQWKDKYLLNAADGTTSAVVEGFALQALPGTAAQLVEAFEALARSGNSVRVEWGSQVRTGLLKRFRAAYDREEDLAWEAEFSWSSRNDEVAPRAAAPPETVFELVSAANAVSDIPLPEDGLLDQDYLAEVLSEIATIEGQVSELLGILDTIDQIQDAPSLILGRVRTAVENLRNQATVAINRLAEIPGVTASTNDRASTTIEVERWRAQQTRAIFVLRRQAQKTGDAVRDQLTPEASRVVTVTQATSLLTISVQEYGTPDEWQFLADINGLDSSIAPAGFQLFVPPLAPMR